VQGDLDKAKDRIGGKSTRVVATLADGQEQIRLLIQRFVPQTQQLAPEECGQVAMEESVPTRSCELERSR
jgi:hypothetical protein